MSKGNKTVSSSAFAGGAVGLFADGSAASPSISFASDTNTGMYLAGADNLAFAIGGVQIVSLASTSVDFSLSSAVRARLNNTGGTFYWDVTNLALAGSIGGTRNARLSSTSTDGNLLVTNSTANGFGLFQLGGTTSSFPALKRNSALIEFRLADDSGYTGFNANAFSLYDSSSNRKANYNVANGLAYSSDQTHRWFDNTNIDGGGAAVDLRMRRIAANVLGLDNGTAGKLAALEFCEDSTTDIGAGSAGSARLYAKDNGAGKTQLVVRFNSGAVQVIATEP